MFKIKLIFFKKKGKKMKELSYAGLRYRANLADPYARIVKKHLHKLINDSGKNNKEIINNLANYGKSYTPNSLSSTIIKSSLDTRTFIRFMLASGLKEFTIKVTDEELLKIEEYEKNKNN